MFWQFLKTIIAKLTGRGRAQPTLLNESRAAQVGAPANFIPAELVEVNQPSPPDLKDAEQSFDETPAAPATSDVSEPPAPAAAAGTDESDSAAPAHPEADQYADSESVSSDGCSDAAEAASRHDGQPQKSRSDGRHQRRRPIQKIGDLTDIRFLGRGVSRGLADRQSDVDRLTAAGLPVLHTPADLAAALELSVSELRWLAFHHEAATTVHYYWFTVPKKSGGERQLAAPHAKLAAAQRWILQQILERVPAESSAHGFVPGRSVVSNATEHLRSQLVVNVDLQDFFPTVTFFRVEGLLRALGYSGAVSTILALLSTECPRVRMTLHGRTVFAAAGERSLPQGACTSPALSNLVCRRLDRRLRAFAQKTGWRYTRYADDLTFSRHDDSQSPGYLLKKVRLIVGDESFALNENKTRILRPSQRQTVTGVVVNDRAGVPRPTVRHIRAILHNAGRTGLDAQNRDQLPHFEDWLRGMIAWITMVNPVQGTRLQQQLDAICGSSCDEV